MKIERGVATRRRVPYVLALPTGGRPAPAVVMAHGMWEDKERLRPLMAPFLRAGLAVAAIDLRGHGARRAAWQRLGPNGIRARGAAYFMDLVAGLALRSALDIHEFATWLRRDPRVLSQRIGLWGNSLGCHAVLAATPLVRPAAVAAAMGNADWPLMWKLSWPYFHPGTRAPAARWTAKTSAMLRLDPVRHARRFPPARVLLLHGRDDHPMVDGMRSLHSRLERAYRSTPDRLRFIEYAGVHAFTDAMATRISAWLIDAVTDDASAPLRAD
jgi:alpha-beta hydrolase superfamily lysophospholipase